MFIVYFRERAWIFFLTNVAWKIHPITFGPIHNNVPWMVQEGIFLKQYVLADTNERL